MFRSFITVLASLIASIAFASAQSISSQCQSGLGSLLLNPQAACLNPPGLLPVLMGGANTSLSGPFNSYLMGFCSQPSCTNATLNSVFTTITTACQTEINSLGLGNVSGPSLTTLIQSVFPLLKSVLCLEDTSNNTLCVIESISSIQPTGGPFTLAALGQFLKTVIAGAVPPVATSAKCNDCSKATYNIVTQAFPGVVNSTSAQNIANTCGADFINGSDPTDVIQTANGVASANSTNGTSSGSNGSSNNSSNNNGALRLGPGVVGALLVTAASFATFFI